MSLPCALIASCSSTKPEVLVKDLLDCSELPDATPLVDNISGYPWHIETKYYTADILLCVSHNKTIGDKTFAERVHAFLLLFDSSEADCIDKVTSWLPFIKEYETPVQMLITDTFTHSSGVDKHTVQNWCLDEGFELVELTPPTESDGEDEEDDFKETVGIQRVAEALKSHMWPNLEMKEKPHTRGPYFRKLMEEEAASQRVRSSENEERVEAGGDAETERTSDDSNTATHSTLDSGSNTTHTSQSIPLQNDFAAEMAGLSSLINSGSPESNFEEMFEKLHLMKEQVSKMPDADRHKHAEKIVTEFWRAIGGDEDEIEGLDSD